MSLLLWVLFLPLIGAFLLLFVPAWNKKLIRSIGFATSLLTFLISLLLWIQFDASSGGFQCDLACTTGQLPSGIWLGSIR